MPKLNPTLTAPQMARDLSASHETPIAYKAGHPTGQNALE
jgi:hypothetical protein